MMVPPSPRHGEICARVVYLVQRFLDDDSIGRVLCNDSAVVTERNPDTVRGADVSYYSYDRAPRGPLSAGLLSVAPDIVFEVLSPSDRWSDVHAKVAEYLHAGVRIVCLVDDGTKTVHVFHPNRPSQVMPSNAQLELADILPGFRVPVERFFS